MNLELIWLICANLIVIPENLRIEPIGRISPWVFYVQLNKHLVAEEISVVREVNQQKLQSIDHDS